MGRKTLKEGEMPDKYGICSSLLSKMLFYIFMKNVYNYFRVLFVCGKLVKGLEPNMILLAPVNEYWLDLALEVPALMRGL
jgi:hypothetical protein